MKIKNLPLIIGIALPLVFIIIISIVIYAPSLFIKPKHNFIYTTNTYSNSYNQFVYYKVENNRITTETTSAPKPGQVVTVYENNVNPEGLPPLYLYDVKNDTSRQITLEEAQKFIVEAGPSSPDGYTIQYDYSHDGIFELFGSSRNNQGQYITKGNGRKKLSGLGGDAYGYRYDYNFRLVGWVK